MEFGEWRAETNRLAGDHVTAAVDAAARGDRAECARHAHRAAMILLHQFLKAAGAEAPPAGESVAGLLDRSAHLDRYFSRLHAEACLLDEGEQRAAPTEDLIDALMEVHFLVGFRAGKLLGFTVAPESRDPRLVPLVTHSTTTANAASIFAYGALYSFNECVRRGLLSGIAKGVLYLHDPRRYQHSVLFHIPDHTYLAGEKVQHSQRKGCADEAMEGYEPGVRLFFRKEELEALPAHDDDGSHMVVIRDQVSLDLMTCAVFPSADALALALAQVTTPGRRTTLAARCLTAPPACCSNPRDYVWATNWMVAEQASPGRRKPPP